MQESRQQSGMKIQSKDVVKSVKKRNLRYFVIFHGAMLNFNRVTRMSQFIIHIPLKGSALCGGGLLQVVEELFRSLK